MVGLNSSSARLAEHVEQLALVDHHVHTTWADPGDLVRLGNGFVEADTAPLADPATGWDTHVGFAVRRWCAPLLDLPAHASPEAYVARRAELGETEVTRRMTRAAGVSDWLVDTGLTRGLVEPEVFAGNAAGRVETVTRLESVAEALVVELDEPGDWVDAYGARVERAAATGVGFKSVLAYRTGFAIDLAPPSARAVAEAARRWQGDLGTGPARLVDPTLIAYGIHTALRTRRPLQLHVGIGDRDLDLRTTDPLLLTPFLRSAEVRGVPILLLHCYPFERSAGYLAQAFPEVHLDVGLAVNLLGAAAVGTVARSLELAPFGQVLYSSDAAGPAELHHLGARQWRTAVTEVLGGWVERDLWSEADVIRVATMVGRDNARRVYGLD